MTAPVPWRAVAPLVLACAACAPLQRSRPAPPGPAAGTVRFDELCARREAVRSLRATGILRYAGPDGRRSFRLAAIVARPRRLRFDLLSPIGLELRVAVDGERLAAFVRRENTLYRGRSGPEALRRHVRIPLSVTCLTDVLLGAPCGCGGPASAAVAAPGKDGSRTLRWRADGAAETLRMDGRLRPVYYERAGGAGDGRLRVAWLDYGDGRASALPTRIRFEIGEPAETVELLWKEYEINAEVAPTAFAIPVPRGARVAELDLPPGASGEDR